MKDYFELDCPYINKCSRKGISCNNCKHNKRKKDYYEPVHPSPIRPWTEPPSTYPLWYITCRWESL